MLEEGGDQFGEFGKIRTNLKCHNSTLTASLSLSYSLTTPNTERNQSCQSSQKGEEVLSQPTSQPPDNH